MLGHLHVPVALEVHDRTLGRVDRQLGEVGAAEPAELGVQIGEVPALQQRIVGEVDTRHHVLGAERDLLGLVEDVVDHPVERHPADDPDRDLLLGDDLRRVQDVELEGVGELVVEQLHPQIPLGEVAGLDRVPQVATVEVGIGTVDLDRLVPHHRLHALHRLPVELDVGAPALVVDEAEGVDAETLHEPEGPRDGAVAHLPQRHVGGLGHQGHEVPEGVVRGLRLRPALVLFLLDRVHQIRELDRVLDEEHRHVVADQVPVALVGVELGGEATHVARQVEGSLVTGHRGETDEDLGLLALLGQQRGPGDVRDGIGALEDAVRSVPAGVDDALRDPLVVEVEDLLP